jgi:hypothetical protein
MVVMKKLNLPSLSRVEKLVKMRVILAGGRSQFVQLRIYIVSKNKAKSALTALSVAMLLVACNGNDHDNPQPSSNVTLKTLTISPSLGKVLKAKVVLKNAANNVAIGEQNTGSTGKVTFTIPSAVSTVIAEVQGGNGAQYFDEATGQMVDLPTGAVLRAATTVVANNSELVLLL